MAKILTETFKIEISRLVKDADDSSLHLDDSLIISSLESVIQEILPELVEDKNLVIEVKR